VSVSVRLIRLVVWYVAPTAIVGSMAALIGWALHTAIHWADDLTVRPQPSIARLKGELSLLPFADKLVVTGTMDKGFVTSVAARAHSGESVQEMRSAFERSVVKRGWVVTRDRSNRGNELTFCRNSIGLSATFRGGPSGGTEALLRLHWTHSPFSPTDCPG
jgi:hypothetical protein